MEYKINVGIENCVHKNGMVVEDNFLVFSFDKREASIEKDTDVGKFTVLELPGDSISIGDAEVEISLIDGKEEDKRAFFLLFSLLKMDMEGKGGLYVFIDSLFQAGRKYQQEKLKEAFGL